MVRDVTDIWWIARHLAPRDAYEQMQRAGWPLSGPCAVEEHRDCDAEWPEDCTCSCHDQEG